MHACTHIYIHTCLQIYLHTDMRAYRHNFKQATLLEIKSGINYSELFYLLLFWKNESCLVVHISTTSTISTLWSAYVYIWVFTIVKHIWYFHTYVETIQIKTCWLTYRHIANKTHFGWWGRLQCCNHGIRFWYIKTYTVHINQTSKTT